MYSFAVFLDNLTEDHWYERLCTNDSIIYPIDTYDLVFDDRKIAESLLNDYRNQTSIKNFGGLETLLCVKHFLCVRCGDVGFIVGGDGIEVFGRNGKYTEEEIETAAMKWGDYWRDYWKRRKIKDTYPKDYVCEITILIGKD